MKVIYFEDTASKQVAVSRVLNSCGIKDLKVAKNLSDGIDLIKEQVSSGNMYDLVVTDMYYPREQGGSEEQSGEELIQYLKDNFGFTKIIVVSSVTIDYPDIIGTVHYADTVDWETKLRNLVKSI